MDQDGQLLQETFGSYAEDGLFWSLIYLNNAVFGTDFTAESRKKLLSLCQSYETIMLSLYPASACSGLITAMKERYRVYADYVDCLLSGSPDTEQALERWQQNGQQIAMQLSKLNTYWKSNEWSALMSHEAELMQALAVNMKDRNYGAFLNVVPICRRVAGDMSQYMSSGVLEERKKQQMQG